MQYMQYMQYNMILSKQVKLEKKESAYQKATILNQHFLTVRNKCQSFLLQCVTACHTFISQNSMSHLKLHSITTEA
jgi:hypothetical protein